MTQITATDHRERRRAALKLAPHFVYRLFDKKGRPLYIGCTANLPQRLGSHASKWWWGQVDSVEADLYPSKYDALDVELDLIREFQPLHNIMSTDVGNEEARIRRHARGDKR